MNNLQRQNTDRKLLDRDWFHTRWVDKYNFKRDWFKKNWIHRHKFGNVQ